MDEVAASFSSILGRSCWNVQRSAGSYILMEFGEPHLVSHPAIKVPLQVGDLRVRAPKRLTVAQGQWSLSILNCFWSLRWTGDEIAFCESNQALISDALYHLSGQRLERVEVTDELGSTEFVFDLGCSLETHPYHHPVARARLGDEVAKQWPADRRTEQWWLFRPDEMVLSVGNAGDVTLTPKDCA